MDGDHVCAHVQTRVLGESVGVLCHGRAPGTPAPCVVQKRTRSGSGMGQGHPPPPAQLARWREDTFELSWEHVTQCFNVQPTSCCELGNQHF